MISNKTNIAYVSVSGGGGGGCISYADAATSVVPPTYITNIRKYVKLDGTEELQVKIGGNWQRIDAQYEASEIMEKL